MRNMYRTLCRRIDWTRPELRSIKKLHKKGGFEGAALAFIAHLRKRKKPALGYSRKFVAALRKAASDEQKRGATEALEGALRAKLVGTQHRNPVAALGPHVLQLGATPDLCECIAERVVSARSHWSDGPWGTTCGICSVLQAAWPLDEFQDAHVVPLLCWMLEQIEAEWNWARTWGEAMLGNASHNWWLHTFHGFWKAGTFFPELKGLSRFQTLSQDFLERSMRLLIEPDGFTKERSGYHWGTVDIFTEFARSAQLNGTKLSPEFHDRLREAAAATWKMLTPDGDVPRNGDSGGSHVPGGSFAKLRLQAACFGIAEAKSIAETLDPNWKPPHRNMLPHLGEDLLPAYRGLRRRKPELDVAMPESGYYITRSNWTSNADWMMIDAGARGSIVSSHDHTAVFNFELYSRGTPLLIDNASGPYGKSPGRMWREGSPAHNVSTVDGEDHIPIRDEWRWDGLVQPVIEAWLTGPRFAYFSGAHEGYDHLRVPGCRRKIFCLRGKYWIIIDRFTASGKAAHTYRVHFHIAQPSRLNRNGRLITKGEKGNLMIAPVSGASGKGSLSPNPYPLDGYDNPDHLTYTRRTRGSDIFVTLLVPFKGSTVPDVQVGMEDVESDERVLSPWEATGLRIRINGREDIYFDQHMEWNLPWRCGKFNGTGRLFHSRCGEIAG